MVQELTVEQIRQALQGISVPPQPQIIADLQMEQVMPNPDLKNIARLISQDSGLSGALLKLVNSPFFGLASRITSIQRAMNLSGSRSVINPINAQSIRGEMSDDTIVTLSRFWDIAQDVVMSCLSLAKWVGYESVDEAYAFGPFHNCGIPLMLKRSPHYMAMLEGVYVAASDGRRVMDTESHMLNTNHAMVGHYIARPWCLPEHVYEATVNHHNALSIFGDGSTRDAQLKNLLAIPKMAEYICGSHRIFGSQPEDHEWNSIGALVLDYVGFTDYDFKNLKGSILELGVGQDNY